MNHFEWMLWEAEWILNKIPYEKSNNYFQTMRFPNEQHRFFPSISKWNIILYKYMYRFQTNSECLYRADCNSNKTPSFEHIKIQFPINLMHARAKVLHHRFSIHYTKLMCVQVFNSEYVAEDLLLFWIYMYCVCVFFCVSPSNCQFQNYAVCFF